MYKFELTIHSIADCGEDLSKGEPIVASYEGNDLDAMKRDIDFSILDAMRKFNANDGETFVELLIERNGEYYDHDEATVFVDLKNNRIEYGV